MALPRIDGVEFDVRFSADGEPIVLHDETLDRVQGVAGVAADLSAAELARVGVPSLADVLAAMPVDAYLDIELKEVPNERFATVLRAVRGERPIRAAVSSFHVDALTATGAILPGWLLVGIGGGLAIPTIIGTAIADLPAHAAGSGSAVVQMSRQIGSVLGTAILVASLGAAATTGPTAPFLHVWWATTGLWLTATATVIGKRTRSWHRRTPPPQRSAAKGSPATIAFVNPPL